VSSSLEAQAHHTPTRPHTGKAQVQAQMQATLQVTMILVSCKPASQAGSMLPYPGMDGINVQQANGHCVCGRCHPLQKLTWTARITQTTQAHAMTWCGPLLPPYMHACMFMPTLTTDCGVSGAPSLCPAASAVMSQASEAPGS